MGIYRLGMRHEIWKRNIVELTLAPDWIAYNVEREADWARTERNIRTTSAGGRRNMEQREWKAQKISSNKSERQTKYPAMRVDIEQQTQKHKRETQKKRKLFAFFWFSIQSLFKCCAVLLNICRNYQFWFLVVRQIDGNISNRKCIQSHS